MYSQNNEEEIILNYFSNSQPGRFIDIGGFHPTQLSNTRCLVEKGWSGVYVEPSPICMESFRKEYENSPNITLIQKAITRETGLAKFFESFGDAVGTLSDFHKTVWSKYVKYNEITVETLSMADFLTENFDDRVKAISIDVEGTNLELFRDIPDYVLNKISLLCIEHENNYAEITSRCKQFGFSEALMNGENLIFVKL